MWSIILGYRLPAWPITLARRAIDQQAAQWASGPNGRNGNPVRIGVRVEGKLIRMQSAHELAEVREGEGEIEVERMAV